MKKYRGFTVTAPLTIIMIVVIIVVGVVLIYALVKNNTSGVENVANTTSSSEAGVPGDSDTNISTSVIENNSTPETTSTTEESSEVSDSGLKAFTDDTIGISFDYPANWTTSTKITDAPAGRSGRTIDATITLTTENNDEFDVFIPAPEVGFEGYNDSDVVKITATDGKIFDRSVGTKANNAAVKNYQYSAWTASESVDSVIIVGQTNSLPQSLIDQLDALVASIAVQE